MTNPAILLDAWAATMWKACWQGSLVVLAVWLICLAIPSMPARCRCWLWRLAILKFMVVLVLPTLVNLPLLPAPPVTEPTAEVSVQIVRQQVPVVPIEPVEFRPSRAVELPSIPAILAFFWIIGVGWSMAHLLVAWQGARKLRKQSRVIDKMPLIEQLAIQARRYGLRTSPRLLATEGDGSPMLIGIFRPAIVIPGGTLRRLSPPELAMVLGHELAHIRRGDLLWNLAAAAVRALFFFHPMVWLSQRRLNLAQEVAADELAILRQHHDPVSYGKLLVSVIGKIGPSRLIPTMSMGTAGSVQSLTRRLIAMSIIGRASRGVIVSSGTLLAAMVLLGIVPWRLVAAESKGNGQPPASQDGPATLPHPAPRAPDALFQRGAWYEAEIKVIERKNNQPDHVMMAPRMRYLAGNECFMVGALEKDKSQALRVTASSTPEGKPIEHTITATVIRDRAGKELTGAYLHDWAKAGAKVGGDKDPVVVVFTSKMTLASDKTGGKIGGKVTATAIDGLVVEVAAEILPVKPSGNLPAISWQPNLTFVGKNPVISYGDFEFPGPQGLVKMELPCVGWTDGAKVEQAR
ncbi:MAG: M56 family metallopeptidase [Thermoguttaceae bacterium]